MSKKQIRHNAGFDRDRRDYRQARCLCGCGRFAAPGEICRTCWDAEDERQARDAERRWA